LEARKKNEEMEKEIKRKFKDTLTFEIDELNTKSIVYINDSLILMIIEDKLKSNHFIGSIRQNFS